MQRFKKVMPHSIYEDSFVVGVQDGVPKAFMLGTRDF